MSSVEKEIRLRISPQDISNINKITEICKPRVRVIDITCGKYGFDSLKKNGYICRVRCRDNNYRIEIKNYQNENECLEKSLIVQSLNEGLEFFKLLNMEPYLVLDRFREIRSYNDLLIYIDEFESIGCYLEIEYQNSTKEAVVEFINMLNLDPTPQEKYGDIVVNKLNESKAFKNKFMKELKKYKQL